ncbi:hypothetical protein AB0C65_27490 [Nocardia sp. NPDC048505]|uniref:hypothetical protein n=1 Tax=Nocardia sp. NPDC048505 TaxID=3155756 RepID=UPI0033C8978F
MSEQVGAPTTGWFGDPIRVVLVALLPLALLLATSLAEPIADGSATKAGKTLILSSFVGVATQLALAPLTIASLIGAVALARNNFRTGAWFARVGSTAATLVCVLVVLGSVASALGPNSSRYEWKPLYSLPATLLAVTPQILTGIANVYILVRLSRRSRA